MGKQTIVSERQRILAKTLYQIKQLKRLAAKSGKKQDAVAIIGMGCRFPGDVHSPAGFWAQLKAGFNAVGEIPASRWSLEDHYDADASPGKMYTRTGAFLGQIDAFDATFFGLSPREAAAMDPQHRLLLEVAWQALEDGAVAFDCLEGSQTGVFVGITSNDYGQLQLQHNANQLDAYYLTGNVSSFAAGRLAFHLGLQGPCMAIDTACSSSLVAAHTACTSLLSGECDMALAGGVNILLLPEWNIVVSQAKMASRQGYCKTFDSGADGYVRGEGCGLVVLKRLSDAMRDNDRIHGIIRGSAANQDGASSGITVPNGEAQQNVILAALKKANLKPNDICYLETHGTGTKLGDPIEVDALACVFGKDRSQVQPLVLGAVKTNIGHLEPAAGIAGLIKSILVLKHRQVPPNLHLENLNPDIPLDQIPAVLPREIIDLPKGDAPLRAGVSSFGASGSNAHLILEAPPATDPVERETECEVFGLSARSEGALRALAQLHAKHLETLLPNQFNAYANTVNTGRRHFRYRLGILAENPSEACKRLYAFAKSGTAAGVCYGKYKLSKRPKVVFLFPGQGCQYPAMAKTLFEEQPVFRDVLEYCHEVLSQVLDVGLLDLLTKDTPEIEAYLAQTRYCQPALFAMGYGLSQMWRSWGIEPSAVMGHSLGEYVAACVAGVFSLEDGLQMVATRARLMQEASGTGGMLSVFASEEGTRQVLESVDAAVCFAALNGPESVVLSGTKASLNLLVDALAEKGIKSKFLEVSHGFHSLQMQPAQMTFEPILEDVTFHKPRIPHISNLTGTFLTDKVVTANYWARQMMAPVLFETSMNSLFEAGFDCFLEMGPQPILLGMAKRFGDHAQRSWLPSLRKGHRAGKSLYQSLAQLYCRGHAIRWSAVKDETRNQPLELPGYPFQRRRHWLDYPLRPSATAPGEKSPEETWKTPSSLPTTLLGQRLEIPAPTARFASVLDMERFPFLGDFMVNGRQACNIGVFVDMALSAVKETLGSHAVNIEDLMIFKPVCLPQEGSLQVHIALEPGPDALDFEIHVNSDDGWQRHVRSRLRRGRDASHAPELGTMEALKARFTMEMTTSHFYRQMWRRKLMLGPSGQWLEHIWYRESEALARLRPATAEESGYRFHPGLIDSAFQLLYATFPQTVNADAIYMIIGWENFEVFGTEGEPYFCRVELQVSRGSTMGGLVQILDGDATVLAEVRGVRLALLEHGVLPVTSSGEKVKDLLLEQAFFKEIGTTQPAQCGSRATILLAPPEEQTNAILMNLLELTAGLLGFLPEELDEEVSLHEMGLDSLMALELKTKIEHNLGIRVTLDNLLSGPTLQELAGVLRPQFSLQTEAEPGSIEAGEARSPTDDSILPTLSGDPEQSLQPFNLTDLQQAYLLGRTSQFELGNVATFFTLEVDVLEVNPEAFERAWNQLVRRHAMLRAIFQANGQQRILESVPHYHIPVLDLRAQADTVQKERLAAISQEMKQEVLAADRWPLFDIRLTRIDMRKTRVHVGMDALIVDAWSTMLLFREWHALYHSLDAHLEPLNISYRDYILGWEQVKRGPAYRLAREYWQSRLETLPPAPELPLLKNSEELRRPVFVHRSGRLEPQAWQRIKKRAKQARVTPSMVVCTAYAQVLATFSKSRHFTLDLLFFNRLPIHEQVNEIVGNFSSTLLLEVDLAREKSFEEDARCLQHQLSMDLENNLVSGVQVLRDLNSRHGGRSRAAMPVVFASTLNLKNPDKAEKPFGLVEYLTSMGAGGTEVGSSIRTPQVWIDHQVMEESSGLLFNWDSVDKLFPEGMVAEMFEIYKQLLHRLAFAEEAWRGVTRYQPLPAPQLQARKSANTTEEPIPKGLLHEPVLAQMQARRLCLAVITEDRKLTYGELDRYSEHLGRELRRAGATPNMLVAIVMEKGWEQVVAACAILKAGAAYLPIDPALPKERIHILLDNGEVSLVVTQPLWRASHDWPESINCLVVDGAYKPPAVKPANRLRPIQKPQDLAYVIYTSGSTGIPKGVEITHEAALNTVADIRKRFHFHAKDRVFGISSLSFDLSVFDLFGTLAAGGVLVLPSGVRDPSQWLTMIRKHKVTVWNSVPALMDILVDQASAESGGLPKSLRLIMMSGDWIPVGLPARIRKRTEQIEIISLGGATEASIWSIYFPIHEVAPQWTSIPYGYPLANQRFHVLDILMAPSPVWVPGELYIAGQGLARGYWRDEIKTAAKFIYHSKTGERLYRTGDMGRYLPGGEIEFLGREDAQVKIQGYRIELGEIEAALNHHPGVSHSAVVAHGDRVKGLSLAAYIVLEPHMDLDQKALQEALAEKLPGYMVPALIVFLEEMPLTANGKVNRVALPDPLSEPIESAAVVLASTPIELALVSFWEELLETKGLGVNQNFFELGGQSFLAMRLMARINVEFGFHLPLHVLFEHGTIAEIASLISSHADASGWTSLICIQKGTQASLQEASASFFCVHPVGGHILCYQELARQLGPGSSFYGLQARGIQGDVTSLDSITAMAQVYVAEVQATQPQGPYRLGGWSLGGIVAFEMACLLRAKGALVDFVVLIDAFLPETDPNPDFEWESLHYFASDLARLNGQNIDLSCLDVRALPPEKGLEIVAASLKEMGALPEEIKHEDILRLWRVHRDGLFALANFLPKFFDGQLISCIAHGSVSNAAEAAPWQRVTSGEVIYYEIPGDHYSLIREPQVQYLAHCLKPHLKPLSVTNKPLKIIP